MKTPLYMCRKKEGISLTQLAKECCSSDSTLSRLERGISKNSSGEVCLKVVDRYKKDGLSLEHLIYPERFPDFAITKE
ncbi:helix-turn-helix transcriptional regulator [Vibrio sp. AND4]|uniref:helix-turn-helix domain-containing protein n=1 Tax=Vibrio sp. AND4 TaxID=314289 RepID=UPI000A01613B|nr:helix-turn-helix transcriptional regulator [Vibrio sp. AND4]